MKIRQIAERILAESDFKSDELSYQYSGHINQPRPVVGHIYRRACRAYTTASMISGPQQKNSLLIRDIMGTEEIKEVTSSWSSKRDVKSPAGLNLVETSRCRSI